MLAPSYITRTVYIYLLPCTQFLSKMQIIRHVLKTGKKTVGLISTCWAGVISNLPAIFGNKVENDQSQFYF